MSRIVVDELVTLIGAEVDKAAPVNVEKFKGQLLVLGDAAMNIAQKVWGFGQRLNASVQQSGMASMGIQQLGIRTGLSTKAIQELGYAVVKTGGDAAAFRADLDKLNNFRPENQPMEDFLAGISRQLSAMSERDAVLFGTQFGMSLDGIRLLRQGVDGMKDLREEAVKMKAAWPESVTRDAALWTQRLNAVKYSLRSIEDRINVGMLPAITHLTMQWREFLADHGEAWGEGFKNALEGAVKGVNNLSDLWDRIKKKVVGDDPDSPGEKHPRVVKAITEGLTEGGIPLVAAGVAVSFLRSLVTGGKALAATEFASAIGLTQEYLRTMDKGVKANTIGNWLYKGAVKGVENEKEPAWWRAAQLAYLMAIAKATRFETPHWMFPPDSSLGLGPKVPGSMEWKPKGHISAAEERAMWGIDPKTGLMPKYGGMDVEGVPPWLQRMHLGQTQPWAYDPWLRQAAGSRGVGGGNTTVNLGGVQIDVHESSSPKATADQVAQRFKRMVLLDLLKPGSGAPVTQ